MRIFTMDGRSAATLILGSTLLSVVLLSACQFSDIVAFRNSTESTLTLRAEVTDQFHYYNCDGDGSDLVTFEEQIAFEIPPEIRMCLEGPIHDPKDTYNIQDLIVVVEIARGSSVCVTLDGENMGDNFVTEGFHRTLVIDDDNCPGSGGGLSAADEDE